MEKLSLANILAYGTIMYTLAASTGCTKARVTAPILYRGSTTIAEDVAPVVTESREDHSKSTVALNQTNGQNSYETSITRLEKKKELLKKDGKLTSEAEKSLSFATAMAKAGEAYTSATGYDDAKRTIVEVKRKFSGNGLDGKLDEASSFVDFMQNVRQNPKDVYNFVISQKARARWEEHGKKNALTEEVVLNISKEEIVNYEKSLENAALRFPYQPGKGMSGWGDEARDVVLEARLNLAKYAISLANASPEENFNTYNLAQDILSRIQKDHEGSKRAPQAIEEEAIMYETIARNFRDGRMGTKLSERERRKNYNDYVQRAKESWSKFLGFTFRGCGYSEAAKAALKKLETEQAQKGR